jgi:uncharacterized protein GlcG (DUF336 family)
MTFLLLTIAVSTAVRSQNTPGERVGGAAPILSGEDVLAVLTVAAGALADTTMAAAVVDRTGAILGVYSRSGAAERTPDIAVALARTAAMFSNDQAPLSSRTVRAVSGIHFPSGVLNTPNAALYGIENTNRGCAIDDRGDALFAQQVPRATSIAGTFGASPGSLPLPCTPADIRGCSHGGPMLNEQGEPIAAVGVTTGKVDVLDSGQSRPETVAVDPGGIPIYRGGKVVGGIGVAGVPPAFAEYAATAAAAGAGRSLDFSEPLGSPGAVFIDGIRLPFFGACPSISCIRETLRSRPPGSAPGVFSDGRLVVLPRGGGQAPEGYLIAPRASARAGGLTADDVRRIVEQAVAVALRTRAQIRLPAGQPARMIISVADEDGEILGAFRMADATMFSLDVAIAKARNAFYFSSRDGYEVLRQYVVDNQYEDYRWEPAPPPGQGWAVTARTLNFGGQPLFPPGIDLQSAPLRGPWFDLFAYDLANPCTEGPGPTRGGNRRYANQSGIVWFAGSAPLYKNGRLAGGLGVSGDGVEQDDYVSQLGSEGFHPPDSLRVDQSEIVTGSGARVRLPYLKFPRHPEF